MKFNDFFKPEYLVVGALLFGTGFFVAKYLMNKNTQVHPSATMMMNNHMGGGFTPINATTPLGERQYSHPETPLNYAMIEDVTTTSSIDDDTNYHQDTVVDNDSDDSSQYGVSNSYYSSYY